MEFQLRRAPGEVPSSIRLDRGDILVMDGLAQSEYENRTASGLQDPRVNLTYRCATQHTASCPLAGVVGCVLPSGVQGLVELGSRVGGSGESTWFLFWGMILLLLIGVCFLWEHEEATPLWISSNPLGGVFLSGSRSLGCGTTLATVTALASPKTVLCLVPPGFFRVNYVFWAWLNMLITKERPTFGNHDVCSVETPKRGILGETLADQL